ncbi:MAG: T9SS type A sorting domain-containing protein [Vicingaceae bacterium]|nr:T9SS type A sorting domain-containing protein [Vicingaceae bacterium]
MKKIFLLVLLASFFATTAKASHNYGGEITYEWVNGNTYKIRMALLVDCSSFMPDTIAFRSSSVGCSVNRYDTLYFSYKEDVSQVCDTMQTSCNGGPVQGQTKWVYEANVSGFGACNDWILSYSLCCRGGAVSNISNPFSANFYIETTFDNSIIQNNKSPYFSDNSRWMIPVNGMNLINAGAYDADGDSLHFSLIAPKSSNTNSLAYSAGHSSVQPFSGMSTIIDSKTGIISTMSPSLGQYLICVKVDEFRNGQLISSVKRDFTTNVYVNSNTLPAITNLNLGSFDFCTVDTLDFDVYSTDPTDTITTSILYPFAPGNLPYFSNTIAPLNQNTNYLADTNTLKWDLAGLSPDRDYVVYINVEDDQCPVKNIQSYAIVVSTSYCVWPGDANNDLVADVWDVLPIGVFNGTNGNARLSASLNWDGQWSPNWGVTQGSGDDIKHVDCNGDATIDANDTTAIMLNYNLTHTKSINSISAGPNDPNLFVDITPDTVGTSAPLAIPIHLGTSTLPADSVYGVAMRISYDKTKIDSIAGVTVDYSNSWLGTKGVDLITLDTNFYDNGYIDVVLVRNDGQMITGFGELLTLNVITIDNLSGKSATYGTLHVDFVKTTIINLNEDLRPHNQVEDSVVIEDLTTGVRGLLNKDDVKVFPNPNNGMFKIYTAKEDVSFEVFSITGQHININSEYINGYHNVDMSSLKKGIYLVRFSSEKNVIVKKVIIH